MYDEILFQVTSKTRRKINFPVPENVVIRRKAMRIPPQIQEND